MEYPNDFIDRVIQGDCLDIMLMIPDKSMNAVIADIPYGTTACKWDTVIPFEPMWTQLKRIAKLKAAIVLFSSQPFTSALVMSNVKQFRYEWIWEKERPTNIFSINTRPGRVHENLVVFSTGNIGYNPIMELSLQPKNNNKLKNKSQLGNMNVVESLGTTSMKISNTYNSEVRYPRSVLRFNRKTRGNKKLHPTQKPVALLEYLICTYTNKGDMVLDFTAGSGTTGVAAKNTGRHFILIEKEKKYCDIAQRRIEETLCKLLS